MTPGPSIMNFPPPFRVVNLGLADTELAGHVDPNHRPRETLAMRVDRTTYELEGEIGASSKRLSGGLSSWTPT